MSFLKAVVILTYCLFMIEVKGRNNKKGIGGEREKAVLSAWGKKKNQ